MSAPSKRGLDSPAEFFRPAKLSRNCVEQLEDVKLDNFLKWCKENSFKISSKVCVEKERACAQYGMVAVENIAAGEVLFTIPRPFLLSPDTCSIAPLLQKAQHEMGVCGWVPIILALLYEYHNPQSSWRPYLDLFPNFTELDLPMFWSKKERGELLAGTGVEEAVSQDLQFLETDFKTKALPFMQKHPDTFSPACQSLSLYMKMVAFVMAYSFNEPPTGSHHDSDDSDSDDEEEDEDDEECSRPTMPMMVPLADILNHVADNNAAITFGEEELCMMSICDIKQGEEVFNTYGEQPNKGLLHMYGFAQCYPDNHYDTVEIPVSVVTEVAKEQCAENLEAKLLFLQKQGLHQERDSIYVVGKEGILTDDELKAVVKVLVMSQVEFEEHEEKEGWSDAESDEEEAPAPLSFENIPDLPTSWKKIIFRCAEVCLSRLAGDREQDVKDMLTQGKDLPSRSRYALFVRFSQRQLLQQLLDACR